MTAKKRDQPYPDLVQQYLPGLILNTMLGIIPDLGDPYVARLGLGAWQCTYRMSCGIQQEHAGRAVPVRQVAVCGPGGKINGGDFVQAHAVNVNHGFYRRRCVTLSLSTKFNLRLTVHIV